MYNYMNSIIIVTGRYDWFGTIGQNALAGRTLLRATFTAKSAVFYINILTIFI